MGDGSFNPFAGGNRVAVTLLRAKIRQLRSEIILGTEYVDAVSMAVDRDTCTY